MERLPIWLSAVGERTAGPGTADMNRFPLNGMRQLRLQRRSSSALYRGIQRKESTGAPQQGSTAVRTVCFCFHYDGSRKNVNKIFKNSSAERVEKFVRKPAANFIGRNKSPEFYVTFRIVTRCAGANKITQPEMR